MATLNYILRRPTLAERIEAALLHYAHSRLEIAKWFTGHPSAAQADRVLTMMPVTVVEKARRSHAARKGPFGLSLKQTAEAAGFEGHDWNYAVLSWEGHARIAGDHVERRGIDPTGAHKLRFKRQVDPAWVCPFARYDQPRRGAGMNIWLVVCCCGWERECSSEWAARSVSKLHPQLAAMDVTHTTRVEGPGDGAGARQLTLT